MPRPCLVFAFLLLALASSAAVEEKTESGDVIICSSKPGDRVLSLVQVTDEGHNVGKASLDVAFPPEGEPESHVINCIMVTDLKPEAGAEATITNGTIGGTRVSIHLESRFTKGLSFSIKLLGQDV